MPTDDTWHGLVNVGGVREGRPGQFFLFEPPRPTPQRIAKLLLFWILMAIPIVLILLTGNGR